MLNNAGMQPNDIITAINGVTVVTPLDFQKVELTPGETVTVTILRGEQELQLPVVITPSPDDP